MWIDSYEGVFGVADSDFDFIQIFIFCKRALLHRTPKATSHYYTSYRINAEKTKLFFLNFNKSRRTHLSLSIAMINLSSTTPKPDSNFISLIVHGARRVEWKSNFIPRFEWWFREMDNTYEAAHLLWWDLSKGLRGNKTFVTYTHTPSSYIFCYMTSKEHLSPPS